MFYFLWPNNLMLNLFSTLWLGVWYTLEFGGKLLVSQTFPPTTLLCPIMVSPPKMVAPE